jgi:hypothetical protein
MSQYREPNMVEIVLGAISLPILFLSLHAIAAMCQ